jgi:hypothetical protein
LNQDLLYIHNCENINKTQVSVKVPLVIWLTYQLFLTKQSQRTQWKVEKRRHWLNTLQSLAKYSKWYNEVFICGS